MPLSAEAYILETPGSPLVRGSLPLSDPGAKEALVEVLACGLCHTDLGYASGSVPTRKSAPLVLGHEVVGRVFAAGVNYRHLVGATVLVPAVLPCGECEFCGAGRGNACPHQKMPGNDIDGGFATHLMVPAHPLVPIRPELRSVDLASLSVVADAVSTAYQAVRRACVGEGDLVVVVGAGGVGSFVVQIARATGAHVVACDVRKEPLELLASHGAEETLNVLDRDPRDVRKEVLRMASRLGCPTMRLRIFECSGTTSGQEMAFGLLHRGATMVQVGYTPGKIGLRLSNLMAFDATIHGTWGCPPEAYPAVLSLIEDGAVLLDPFVEKAPMSRVNELLEAMSQGALERRMVMDPRA